MENPTTGRHAAGRHAAHHLEVAKPAPQGRRAARPNTGAHVHIPAPPALPPTTAPVPVIDDADPMDHPPAVLGDAAHPANTGPLDITPGVRPLHVAQRNRLPKTTALIAAAGMVALVGTGALAMNGEQPRTRASLPTTGEQPVTPTKRPDPTPEPVPDPTPEPEPYRIPATEPVPEETGAPAIIAEPVMPAEPAPAPEPAPVVAPAPPVTEVLAQPGDTMYAIAQRHGKDWQVMLAANGMTAYDPLYVGQTVVLEGPSKLPPPPVPAPAAKPAPVPPVPAFVPPVAAAPAPPVAVAPAPAPVVTDRAQRIVKAALAQVGEYQDCVKMTSDALATVGINWYDWPYNYGTIGYAIAPGQERAGDLIYYADGGGGVAHIAIYIGGGQAVHGGWFGNRTEVQSAFIGSGPVFIRLHGA